MVLTLAASSAAAAAPARVAFDIPAGRLGDALIRMAEQADVTIGSIDPAVARLATPAIRGRLGIDDALRRLLAGLPARAERIDGATWRIVTIRQSPRRRPPRQFPPSSPPQPDEIVITAAKTGTY